jgi:class 3 adenylate cyclase/predicted ATPase
VYRSESIITSACTGGCQMDFYAMLDEVIALLRQRQRVTYRALKVQFQLDDEALAALKEELIEAQHLATDEAGRLLVWTVSAETAATSPPSAAQHAPPPAPQAAPPAQGEAATALLPPADAERRQLTVLFCDLVESTALARRLDPEDYRAAVRAYQATCADVIQRFDGTIAQYLGDGLLVYFGYPQAHEDDAQRAVRAGLALLEALAPLQARLAGDKDIRLAVRVGIHTGLVVVGAVGTGGRQESLALGDTPNIAARLQGLAGPDTVVVSDATWRMVRGYFAGDDLGAQALKGVEPPVQVYRVRGISGAQSRLDVVSPRGLTPLVGRETEVAVLRERWAQARDGLGQVVLLSGEAGIGKSRLVMALKEHMAGEPHTRWECRGSPYFQDSALYPLIDLAQRALQFGRDESPAAKLQKIAAGLARYGLAQPETVALWAALLSVPLADPYPPLHLTPQRQKQQTLEAIVALLLALAVEQPVLFIVEDLHWIDPSTLEFLTLLLDQGPVPRLLTLLTCRPEFSVPWGFRAHLTPLTLTRLPQSQVVQIIARVAGGKPLPAEVVAQIVAKTDGVLLFVEDLTKMVLETGLLREQEAHYELLGPLPPLAIPTTLHDSLMARLDRLTTVKTVAQLGATIGRTFAYDLLRAVASLDDATLQQGLRQLVEVELVYQRGGPPQATYTFKHALIQDAAYQSLLKSTRQQYHQRIAQVLEAQFPETAETQPELLAHHYTEAGLGEQAMGYWQQAGQRAVARSAHVEAISHLTKGLALLTTLPETPARAQQELVFQTTLSIALVATKGWGAPEVEKAQARARELCQQMQETPQLFAVLYGQFGFYITRGVLPPARAFADQLLELAQRLDDPALLCPANLGVGVICLFLGELTVARTYLEQGIGLYDAQRHQDYVRMYGVDPGVLCLCHAAFTLWLLGYPDQALQRSHATLAFAQKLGHPYSQGFGLTWVTMLHQVHGEEAATQEQAETLLALSTEQLEPYLLAGGGRILQGWVLAARGQVEDGIAQMGQGLAAWQATGAELLLPYHLSLLAETHGRTGQAEEGFSVLTKALSLVERHEERWWEAEIHRLRGELYLKQATPDMPQAEACFQQALTVARRQQAKSLELRAAMSLSRLWQQQGKRDAAHELLAPLYSWFTEGFDTADLQEATTLLAELEG